MSYDNNDKINDTLYDAVFHAQISHELGGESRRKLLRKARAKTLGHARRMLDKILALSDEKLDEFFEQVMVEFGI